MLQAPTNDRKTKADASAKTAEQFPEQEQALQLLGGLGQARQSQPLQQRNNLTALQKAYGNQAVLRMKGRSPVANPMQGVLQRKCASGNSAGSSGSCAECQNKQEGILQTKLQISDPGDRYEQEADLAANQVMQIPDPTIQRQMESEKEERMVQKKAVANQTTPDVQGNVNKVLSSPGQLLDPVSRDFMEQRFGYNFSQVRVHSDVAAEQSARAVNALAYTVGRDIVFGAGQYAPHTIVGQHLLAHELTHVVQQGGNVRALQEDSKVGEENDRYEQEAERIADQCMSGAQVQPPSMVSSTLIQRTKVCSKRLDSALGALKINHAYIDDTGMDNCLGPSMPGNYAIQTLFSGNFVKGCAVKTATSTDPQTYTPNVKQCDPAPGVTNLSQCLLDAYSSYPDPSVYKNPFGPNSNTFAATLAKTCCADGSSKGLGTVPGWDANPAPPCPQQPKVFVAGGEESPEEEAAT